MIIKSFSIDYEKLFNIYKVNLIYGENYHLKNEIVEKLCKIFKKNNYKITFFKQEEIIKNITILENYINQDSLFGDKEIIIIRDTTDKLLNYIEIENFINTGQKNGILSTLDDAELTLKVLHAAYNSAANEAIITSTSGPLDYILGYSPNHIEFR